MQLILLILIIFIAGNVHGQNGIPSCSFGNSCPEGMYCCLNPLQSSYLCYDLTIPCGPQDRIHLPTSSTNA
uniref:GRANULINS domain-containing protein n=1 Tax=Panagrellus redivivus TaxID=6233 RepID=A0A7E4UYP0_PANRE